MRLGSGALDVLAHVGEVIVPAAVEEEHLRLVDDWPTTRPAWSNRRALDPTQSAILPARDLLSGLLTDDAEARVIAGLAGIEVHGSLGVVLWAVAAGHLDLAAAHSALDGLENSSLWI